MITRIALTGIKRSGKDTVGKHLIEQYGFEKYAFADPLKEVCRSIFMFNDDQLYGDSKETPDERWNGLTPRRAFQIVGTDLLHNIDSYSDELKEILSGKGPWIHRFKLLLEQQQDKRWLLSDCRFKKEAEFARENGFTIVKVVREGLDNKDSHRSETELSEIKPDFVIRNVTGKLNETLEQMDEILI